MNSAIIFIKNDKELELAKTTILGKTLIEYTLFELNRLDLNNIYLVGGKDLQIDGVLNRFTIKDVVSDLDNKEGKCLLLSPFYPLISKSDYQKLLFSKFEEGTVMLDDNKQCAAFVLKNSKLSNYEKIKFKAIAMDRANAKKVRDFKDIPAFTKVIKLRINKKLIEKGVKIIDPYTTYISLESTIDRNTTIYPNTFIEGKCLIGKNNVITSGSHLIDVVIGDNNSIKNSTITDSIIHNGVNVGPYAQIRNNSEIYDEARIGNYVEIKNSKIGRLTRVAHLAYMGDATVGEDVNIGCGVITINYDGSKKYPTTIKNHAFIGSNANLIAPITVGEYAMVAAGSTVNQDVADGDMAISRLYQTNKKGYGYKYINKEN